MPYAALEKEMEKLNETQLDAVSMFVRFLVSNDVMIVPVAENRHSSQRVSMYGALKGKVGMTSDFDAPIEDFAKYM